MKKRTSFVSNSSSSSFVVVGYIVKKNELEDESIAGFAIYHSLENIMKEDECVVGKHIADGDENGLDFEKVKMIDILRDTEKLKVYLEEKGLKPEELHIFTGTLYN